MKKVIGFLFILVLFVSILSFDSNDVQAKGISAPTKFDTSSRAYSTTLTWNKVKGATGYIVYYKKSSGTYKQLKNTKSNTSTHYNLKGDTKYYYLVKSYVSNRGRTSYSNYSKTTAIRTTKATKPKILTFMGTTTIPRSSVVFITIKNVSNKSIYVHRNAYLYDHDYEDYDRYLKLSLYKNNKTTYPNPLRIKPNKEELITFEVRGNSTWYDEDSLIYFTYKYEGKDFEKVSSTNDNDAYIDSELDLD